MGFQIQQIYVPAGTIADVTTLKNNELKVTYYSIVTGTSGTITPPSQATFNDGEFGLSGNAILSKIDGSNKPTFESPRTAGGSVVTASLNTTTGAWLSSGTYTDSSVALIYSLKIKAIYYSNLTYFYVIESESITEAPGVVAPLSYTASTNKYTTSMSTNKLIGRGTAGTGVFEEITIGTNLSLIGTTLNATSSGGDVVGPASSTDNAIVRYSGTTGKLIDQAASPVIHNDDGSVTFPAIAGPSYTAGKLGYDTTNETLTFFNNEADIALQIGQETYIRVYNNTGSTIANGAAVYISGSSAGLPTIALAKADSSSTTNCIGLGTHSIENNTIGYVTSIGLVRNIDTSAFAPGTVLFLSASSAGAWTSTEPSGTVNYSFRIGFVVTQNATTGSIQVIPSTAMKASNLPGYQGYAIQVVLNGGNNNPGDATTYYYGVIFNGTALSSTEASRRTYIPKSGTVKAIYVFYNQVAGTGETSTVSFRLNNTTDTTISSLVTNDSNQTVFSNTGLSISVAQGDFFNIKWVTPTWATNPTAMTSYAIIYVE